MFQLIQQPDPEQMFHQAYPFSTGSSARMTGHFRQLSQILKDQFLNPDSFIVEIGSNDGTFLENFHHSGCRYLGIEPSANVAQKCLEKGIPVNVEFFNAEAAERILQQSGKADVVLAANCLCHIPDLASVFLGIDRLLQPHGVVIFEDPYLGEVLAKTAYDQIYDEHVFLFSVTSMHKMLDRYGFEIFDLEPQWTHGGSMRYFICRKAVREISPKVAEWLQQEKTAGLQTLRPYQAFKTRCEFSRDQLRACLQDFKRRSILVSGYAATSKSTTVLNYCGMGPELISYVSDTTPEKQWKFTPGSHIPILPYEIFKKDYPKAAVLFAWNHAGEILEKEKSFRESGGKWIHYIPEVRVE